MDRLENMVETHYLTGHDDYYIAEIHMAVGNRVNAEPDYWVCKYGGDVKAYLGTALNREKVEKVVRILEQGT